MTPRAYYRELDRHVVRIEAPGASPFDPDVAIPVRANAPAPDEWTTLVRALEPVAPLEPADNPAGKGLLAITCDSETWTTVHRFAGHGAQGDEQGLRAAPPETRAPGAGLHQIDQR